ncbi:hypothetical protein Glove_264g80 [Diversispora epigaea]|uniref:Uncharacterized protein n=1 Tax=Diversispora epigaea TaxID=1348612 RepID=A0A397IAW7_9GLOM|nr:hypothetical protein Glove_264g80 [Diversispora epigaea]
MVIAKRRNDYVDKAIKQKNETLFEIVERELFQKEKDSNYENPVTVRLPASNSTTTSPFATVGIFGTTSRQRRRSNETPQNFNFLNQQLAEAYLTVSNSSDSSDTDTEDEMANTVLDYLEDNLYNHTSLQVDPFYGDGTQDPLQ